MKLSKRENYCRSVADRIHKLNPTFEQILEAVLNVYSSGYGEGYDDCTLDNKKQREYKEAKRKEEFNALKDVIEDRIHIKRS